ncbi:ABC transporter ATP-binding protein [Pigmentiphaga aceris]|uniref:ABC transporter ATP-binding protein n=1 Tax=Pigmentiphaga aceris TaxID=1940612 RepID=UPI001FEC8D39|nr:ABC transporter ATP-binding protein [Pigmentiphaga aceris]
MHAQARAAAGAPAAVEVEDLVKRFDAQLAVDRVSLSVAPGEIVCLLGPSGCGKTTTLNLVAGFLRPDGGQVRLAGRVVDDLPPHRRQIGMVFQSYALFPHLSVLDNAAFGLTVRGMPRRQARAKALDTLALVQLADYAQRMPQQLSGGQQQRVSIARALAYQPELLLLDEPFSSLDARLRISLRDELKQIQRRLGISALFVTHDQEEAMQLADRVVVMQAGRVAQQGTPHEVYFRPNSRFVAEFLGEANFLPVTSEGDHQVVGSAGSWRVSSTVGTAPGTLMLRPERIALCGSASEAGTRNQVSGRVIGTHFRGASQGIDVQVGDAVWRVTQAGFNVMQVVAGQDVVLAWLPEDGRWLADA